MAGGSSHSRSSHPVESRAIPPMCNVCATRLSVAQTLRRATRSSPARYHVKLRDVEPAQNCVEPPGRVPRGTTHAQSLRMETGTTLHQFLVDADRKYWARPHDSRGLNFWGCALRARVRAHTRRQNPSDSSSPAVASVCEHTTDAEYPEPRRAPPRRPVSSSVAPRRPGARRRAAASAHDRLRLARRAGAHDEQRAHVQPELPHRRRPGQAGCPRAENLFSMPTAP